MQNTQKIKQVKRLVMALVALLVFVTGYAFGGLFQPKASTSPSSSQVKISTKEGATLTPDYVEKFLIAFFTKKDLSENRNRFKPYLTKSLYDALVLVEDSPEAQAYKGYAIDFVFESAELYIDTDTNKVIAKVVYTNTLLQEKGNLETAITGNRTNLTLHLTYTKDTDGTYLVNKMDTIVIDTPENQKGTAYGY